MKSQFAEAPARIEAHGITFPIARRCATDGKLTLKFAGEGRPFSLTLDAGLYTLLDDIACMEDLSLGELLQVIRRRRSRHHSLHDAVCIFIGHYYFLKAHAPFQPAMPVAFQAPPLRLRNRPHPVRKALLNVWREATGCDWIDCEG
jgi:predicted DNA-binding ribbon-helix-helix protein